MSAEISVLINKNKKKFKPNLGKRKRTSEENNTRHDEKEPASANKPPKSVKQKHTSEESSESHEQQELASANKPPLVKQKYASEENNTSNEEQDLASANEPPKSGKRKRIIEENSTSLKEQELASANKPPKLVKQKHTSDESSESHEEQELASVNKPPLVKQKHTSEESSESHEEQELASTNKPPKLGKRKRIAEESSTSLEEQELASANKPPKLVKQKHTGDESSESQQEPAKTNEPSPNTIQPIAQDYLATQMPSPELLEKLTRIYPKLVKKVTKSFKYARPKDHIPANLPTAEDRRKQSGIAQESLFNETQKQIEELKRKRKEQQQRTGLAESALAPQVKLVRGKIVLDEDSLEVSRSDPNYKDIVTDILIENQQVRLNTPWTPLETQVFYDGLSIYGLDFQKIANTLVGRTRESVLSKYHREDARFPEKVAKYMFKKPTGNV